MIKDKKSERGTSTHIICECPAMAGGRKDRRKWARANYISSGQIRMSDEKDVWGLMRYLTKALVVKNREGTIRY